LNPNDISIHKQSIQRPLFDEEWSIFAQYARRIRCFTIHAVELDMISDRVVQALVSTPSALLPNLRRLQWCDGRECFFPLLRMLLVSTIRSILLCSALSPAVDSEPLSGKCWTPSSAKTALVASLAARCPTIQEFDCPFSGDAKEALDAVCEVVCGWHDLVRLTTASLNIQMLAHLASLSSLKYLAFKSSDFADDTRPNSIPTFIRNLDTLSITASSHSQLTRCLKSVQFLSCRWVELRIACSDSGLPYNPPDIPDFIVSISECFSPDLECLDFDFDCECLDEEVLETLSDSRFALDFSVLSPLLPFNRLISINLDWFCTARIDDDALMNMVQSWPHLKFFALGGGAPWLTPPSVTFIGLVHLIQHCRHIHSLKMPFRAFSIDTNSEPFSTTAPNDKISYFFVGISPIVDPLVVASQLHTLMPNLTEVSSYTWGDDSRPPSVAAFDAEWVTVNEYLRVLTKGAEMLEKMDESLEECLLTWVCSLCGVSEPCVLPPPPHYCSYF
jgi:hypothetical protein